jgi:hypothetical protein
MAVDMRQVATGVGLLLVGSALLVNTGVSGGFPFALATVASLGMVVGVARSVPPGGKL